jgi:hyperosmotically inducible protein
MPQTAPARRPAAVVLLALLCPLLLGAMPWTTIYGVARDERDVKTIAADKAVSTEIKAKLMDKDKKKGLAVKVYCFTGRVFLVGALDDEAFTAFAADLAQKTKNVKQVETFWVKPAKEDTLSEDLKRAAKIRAALIGDKSISATQIETEVFGGTVVLLGMVGEAKAAVRAEQIAKAAPGVRTVKSFLIVTGRK